MPGRNDFGILRSRALTDPRVMRAAALYTETRIAREETAHAAVLGHVTMLGLWASRETDDGVLSETATAEVSVACVCGMATARKIVAALTAPDVDLLTRNDAGKLRLRGFDEAYRPLLSSREAGRARSAASRERRASRGASQAPSRNGVGSYAPDQTVTGPDLPPRGGPVTSVTAPTNGHTHDTPCAADRAVLEALDRKEGAASGHSSPLWQRLRAAKKALAANEPPTEDVVALIDEATSRWPDVAQDVRRTFAMASNQRAGLRGDTARRSG